MILESFMIQVGHAVVSALTGVPVGRKLEGTFDERVAEAAAALRDASETVTELEGEIAARREAVERLEQQRKILEVDRENVEAIANLLNDEMRADTRRALWIGIASNAVFFVLGVAVTLIVQ